VLTKKIVVTESAELLSVLETSFFRREGFNFFPVRSGDMIYRMVEAEAPAMAILDLEVLGSDGPDCCRCIKLDPLLGKTPRMVVLPMAGGGTLAEGCRQAGCEVLVARPLESGQLLDTACVLLGISQRLARRIPVDIRAAYAVAGGKRHAGRVINLHAGGLFIAAEKLFPVGTGLAWELALPGIDEPLRYQGRVAWVNHPEWLKRRDLPSGMGLQLLDAGPAARESLAAYLAGFPEGGD